MWLAAVNKVQSMHKQPDKQALWRVSSSLGVIDSSLHTHKCMTSEYCEGSSRRPDQRPLHEASKLETAAETESSS